MNWIIVIQNPNNVLKQRYVGPFDTLATAIRFSETNIFGKHENWWYSEMETPEIETPIERLRSGINQLYLTLTTAKEKLEHYHKAHGGEYLGGYEYTALMRAIEEDQKLAIRLQNKDCGKGHISANEEGEF